MTMHCDIVSAEKEIFSGPVTMLLAKGQMGELGIAPRHAQLITLLEPGPVRVELQHGGEEFFFIGGGILEVQPHTVTVLADTVVRGEDLDEAQAQKAKEDAERALENRTSEMDLAKAQAQLAMAVAELHAIQRLKNNLR